MPVNNGSATATLGYNVAKGRFEPILIDETNRTLQITDEVDSCINAGNHWYYFDSNELDAGNSQEYILTTPLLPTQIHLFYNLDGVGITRFDVYRSCDRLGVSNQSGLVNNSNDNVIKTHLLSIYKGITGGTTDGDIIRTYKSGALTNRYVSFANLDSRFKLILRENTKYLLKITSFADNNLTNCRIWWHEHCCPL